METTISRLHHFLHQNLLWCLLGSYALAAYLPMPGLVLRQISFGKLDIGGGHANLTIPTLLLMILLFNAAVNVEIRQMGSALRQINLWGTGLIVKLFVPVIVALSLAWLLSAWHSWREMQSLLVGVAVVGCMPIAGASTAWSQKAGGSMALSLMLVIASTLISPVTTPWLLGLVSKQTQGVYAAELQALSGAGTQLFLVIAVVLPAVLGLATGSLLRPEQKHRLSSGVRATNLAILLLLNYVNAVASLPQVFAIPDWDFLLLLAICLGLRSVVGFAFGYAVGRMLKAKPAETISLTFGLGMNNNGSALVLVTSYLTDVPEVVLAIVAYNLIQQLVAGLVDRFGLNAKAFVSARAQ